MRLDLVLSAVLYLVVVQMQMQMRASNCCLEKERESLLEIKAFLVAQGDDFAESELASWVDDRASNCCAWERVKCSDPATGHVTDLSLHDIPPDFQMFNVSLFRPFQELRSLDLSGNYFGGWSNNEEFPRLTKLETLDLSNNELNSSIFSSLRELTSLRTLKLSDNMIGGAFPAQGFVNFSRLELLDLSSNLLHGSLGEDLQNLRNLTVLGLSDNQLNNSMEGLCKMRNLVEVDLNNNMFNGQLPGCLSTLTNLQVLDLSNNLLSGNFPSFISNLTSLAYLSFFENYLQGSFSLSTLANHSKLQVLYISSQSPKAQIDTEKTQWVPTFQLKSIILQSCNLNIDKGSVIPHFLLYQSELQFVDLSHNKLRGAFPSWLIQNNSRLETLFLRNNSLEGYLQLYSISQDMNYMDVSNNKLSGSLPKDIGASLPNTISLNLSMNNIGGNIPTSIGKMTQLYFLDLSHNHFSGVLPEELATYCINLNILKLSNNSLRGNIPKFKSMDFARLYLDNNNFSGTLEELVNNTSLYALDISSNSISGAIPDSIGKFVSMKILLMAKNELEGEIPNEFSNMSNLVLVDLSENRLSGSISYFNLSFIRYLYLQKNALSGIIPSTLAKSSNLVVLDLRDNNFYGNIPTWMDQLSRLRVLLLGRNEFHGQIPIQICKLKNVTIMDLSRNMIDGTIPSCFTNLSLGMERNQNDDQHDDFQFNTEGYFPSEESYFNASTSIFYPQNGIKWDDNAQVVAEFRTKSNFYSYTSYILESMTGLDLSCNKLTGLIPSQIGDLRQVRALNLSHNYLLGFIPKSFSNLTQIESLDLSFNNLSGQIPYELTTLNFLSIFNVSYNNLSGTPPSTGQFANYDEENYKGNPNLCGPLLKHKCENATASPPSQSNNTEEKETTLDMVAFYWSFTASYITILLGFIIILCINAYWRMVWFYYISKIIHKCFPSFPLC